MPILLGEWLRILRIEGIWPDKKTFFWGIEAKFISCLKKKFYGELGKKRSKIRYIMITLTLNLSKEAETELEKDLKHLEEITKKPREFHVKEALVRYLEDMEDIRDALESRGKKEKTYTTEELERKLGI